MPDPRIVVIDANSAVRHGLQVLFSQRGYVVLGHAHAATAAAFVSRHQPDLVIVDVALEVPEAGLDLLHALRCDPATAALPILVWSTDPALATTLYRCGLEDMAALSKYDDVSLLVSAVDQLVAPRGVQASEVRDPGHAPASYSGPDSSEGVEL